MLSSTTSLPLSNKVALVTGGCKNLGALIARQLAPLGCHLALHYNSDSTKRDADALLKELTENYKDIKVKIFQAELTTANAVTNLFNEVAREFGGLDIMINTVGKVLKKPIIEISEPEYDEMFAYVFPRFDDNFPLPSSPYHNFLVVYNKLQNLTSLKKISSLWKQCQLQGCILLHQGSLQTRT